MKRHQPQQKTQIPSIRTLDSSNVDVEKFETELEQLIGKYYGGMNGTIIGENIEDGKDGFFMVFLRKMKIEGSKDNWIRARTFGLNMTVGQIEEAFGDTLERIVEEGQQGSKPIPIA